MDRERQILELDGAYFSYPICYLWAFPLPSHIHTWGLSKTAMQSLAPGVIGIQARTARPGTVSLRRFFPPFPREW